MWRNFIKRTTRETERKRRTKNRRQTRCGGFFLRPQPESSHFSSSSFLFLAFFSLPFFPHRPLPPTCFSLVVFFFFGCFTPSLSHFRVCVQVVGVVKAASAKKNHYKPSPRNIYFPSTSLHRFTPSEKLLFSMWLHCAALLLEHRNVPTNNFCAPHSIDDDETERKFVLPYYNSNSIVL